MRVSWVITLGYLFLVLCPVLYVLLDISTIWLF
jgi:hypothetical protein